jgi:hypothetical protein
MAPTRRYWKRRILTLSLPCVSRGSNQKAWLWKRGDCEVSIRAPAPSRHPSYKAINVHESRSLPLTVGLRSDLPEVGCITLRHIQLSWFWCIWGFWAGEGSLADRGPTGREAQMPYFRPFPVTDESDRTRVCARRRAIVRRCTRTRIVQKKNRHSSGCDPMVVAEHSAEALSALNRVMG